MNFEVEHGEQGITLIRLSGRLDAAAAPNLLACVKGAIAEGRAHFAIDLAGISFVDSTGFGVLVSGLKAARRAEGDLRLISPGPQVQRLLRLTTLDRVFVIAETHETAWA
jgi:anti-anti-sigma factor